MAWDLTRARGATSTVLEFLQKYAGDSVRALLDKVAEWAPERVLARYGAEADITVQVLRTCKTQIDNILGKIQAQPTLVTPDELAWLGDAVTLWKTLVIGLDLQAEDPSLEGALPVVLAVGVTVTIAGLCFAVVAKDIAITLRDWLAFLNNELEARKEAMRTGKTLQGTTAPESPTGGDGSGWVVAALGLAAVGGTIWFLNQKK